MRTARCWWVESSTQTAGLFSKTLTPLCLRSLSLSVLSSLGSVSFFLDACKNTTTTKFYPNGKVRSTEVSTGRTRVVTDFYSDGKVESVERFLRDRLHGKYEFYHPNGKKSREMEFKNGKRDGHSIYWYSDETKALEHFFVNDVQHGLQRTWHPNGKREEEVTYVHGKREGKSEVWFNNEKLSYEFNYVDDKRRGMQKSWYGSEKKHYEQEYVHGKRHGVSRRWYENGNMEEEAHFINDQEDGKQTVWTALGVKVQECYARNGVYHGKHNSFDRAGNLVEQTDYVDGKKHGFDVVFAPDGSILMKAEYVMDIPKKVALRMLYLLRKLKWIRLARLVKTKAFIEWWYSPDNYGGKFSKKSMLEVYTGIGKRKSLESTETQPDPKKQKL